MRESFIGRGSQYQNRQSGSKVNPTEFYQNKYMKEFYKDQNGLTDDDSDQMDDIGNEGVDMIGVASESPTGHSNIEM